MIPHSVAQVKITYQYEQRVSNVIALSLHCAYQLSSLSKLTLSYQR